MNTPTPGPWKWIERKRAGGKNSWELIHPANGYLLVMDFVRLGMGEATFRLAKWEGDERGNMGGLMVKAHDLDIANHPDARLIAAAPAMYAALEAVRSFGSGSSTDDGISVSYLVEEALKQARMPQ